MSEEKLKRGTLRNRLLTREQPVGNQKGGVGGADGFNRRWGLSCILVMNASYCMEVLNHDYTPEINTTVCVS